MLVWRKESVWRGMRNGGGDARRFTRNFHTFLTPFGVEGWFLVAQVVCAQAMLQPKQELRWVLALFFRCAPAPLPTLRSAGCR